MESARGTVRLEKDGATWKITAPEALKADSGAVSNLLWKIRDLRATGFLSDGPGDIARYLAKPEVTVRIWEEGAAEPKTLLLRAFSEKPGGTPAAVAAVAGQGPVMLVEAKALDDLSRGATDLRDRSVFPAFEPADVKRARITGGGKVLVVDRSGENEWKVVEPSRGPAKEVKVADLLMTLKSLRWKDIVSAKGDDAARYGLDRPELEVTLAKTGDAELGTLLIGKREGDVTYVKLKSGPAIYAVEDKLLGDLRKAPSEIPGWRSALDLAARQPGRRRIWMTPTRVSRSRRAQSQEGPVIRQRRSVMVGLAVATVAVVSVLVAGPAWATGPLSTRNRVTVRPGAPVVQSGNADAAGPQHRLVPSNPANGSQHIGPSYPFGSTRAVLSVRQELYRPLLSVRQPVLGSCAAAPVFAAPPPPAPRWVHGYWGQQWVPQYYTYDAWIPGYFARNGAWVQGRYEPRTAESGGYYERVWVEGYWTE